MQPGGIGLSEYLVECHSFFLMNLVNFKFNQS